MPILSNVITWVSILQMTFCSFTLKIIFYLCFFPTLLFAYFNFLFFFYHFAIIVIFQSSKFIYSVPIRGTTLYHKNIFMIARTSSVGRLRVISTPPFILSQDPVISSFSHFPSYAFLTIESQYMSHVIIWLLFWSDFDNLSY